MVEVAMPMMMGPAAGFGPGASRGGSCDFRCSLSVDVMNRLGRDKAIQVESLNLATGKRELDAVDPIGIYKLITGKTTYTNKVTGEVTTEVTLLSPDSLEGPGVWTDAGEHGTGSMEEYQAILSRAKELANTNGPATMFWISSAAEKRRDGLPEHRAYLWKKNATGEVTAYSYQFTGSQDSLIQTLSHLSSDASFFDSQTLLWHANGNTVSHQRVFHAYQSALTPIEREGAHVFLDRFRKDSEQPDSFFWERVETERKFYEKELAEKLSTVYKGDIESAIQAYAPAFLALARETDRSKSADDTTQPSLEQKQRELRVDDEANNNDQLVLAAYERKNKRAEEEEDEDENVFKIRVERPKISVKKQIIERKKEEKEPQKEKKADVSNTQAAETEKRDGLVTIATISDRLLKEPIEEKVKHQLSDIAEAIVAPFVPVILGLNKLFIEPYEEEANQPIQTQQELVPPVYSPNGEVMKQEGNDTLQVYTCAQDAIGEGPTTLDIVTATAPQAFDEATNTHVSRSEMRKKEEEQEIEEIVMQIIKPIIPVILGLNDVLITRSHEIGELPIQSQHEQVLPVLKSPEANGNGVVVSVYEDGFVMFDSEEVLKAWEDIFVLIYQTPSENQWLSELEVVQPIEGSIQKETVLWQEAIGVSEQILELFIPSFDPTDSVSDDIRIDTNESFQVSQREEFIGWFQDVFTLLLDTKTIDELPIIFVQLKEPSMELQLEEKAIVVDAKTLIELLSHQDKNDTQEKGNKKPEGKIIIGENVQRLSFYLSLYDDKDTSLEMKVIVAALMKKELMLLDKDKSPAQRPIYINILNQLNTGEADTLLLHTLDFFVTYIQERYIQQFDIEIHLDPHSPLFCRTIFFVLCYLMITQNQPENKKHTLYLKFGKERIRESVQEIFPHELFGYHMERLQLTHDTPAFALLPFVQSAVIYQWLA